MAQLDNLKARLQNWYYCVRDRRPRAENGDSCSITFTCYDTFVRDEEDVVLSFAVKTEDEEAGL